MLKKLSFLPFLMGLILFTGGGFYLGYEMKVAKVNAPETHTCEIPDEQYGYSPDLRMERNNIWSFLNGEPKAGSNSMEAKLAISIIMIFSSKATPQTIGAGLDIWRSKSVWHLSTNELKLVVQTIMKGTPAERLSALKDLTLAEFKANQLLQTVLADEDRLKLFFQGKKILLEETSETIDTIQLPDAGVELIEEPPEEADYHQDLMEEYDARKD